MKVKMGFCHLLIFVVAGCRCTQGVYLYFPGPVTKAEAELKCEKYGMTLLEPRTQDVLDLWNSVKTTLFSLQQEHKNYEPWIGLTHDGSQSSDKSHFRWRDAGPVDFLSWPDGEPDNIGNHKCVRIRNNKFGTKQCTDTFSVVCQPPTSLSLPSTRKPYKKEAVQRPGQLLRRYRRIDATSYKDSDWLLAMSVPNSSDRDSCVLACQETLECSVVDADQPEPCVIFIKAFLAR